MLKISLERYMNNPALVPISDVEPGTICVDAEEVPVLVTGRRPGNLFEIVEFDHHGGRVRVCRVPAAYQARPMTSQAILSITQTRDEDA